MTELIKKISTPTYFYVLLIFIGYINYFTFYIFFDINIINYLTFGELLMSFLNLTIPILILLAIILFLEITIRIRILAESKETIERKREYTYGNMTEIFGGSVKNIKRLLKEKKWKSFSTYLWLSHGIFQLVSSIIIYLFILIYPFHLFFKILGKNIVYEFGPITLFILGFLWLMLFDDVLEKIYKSKESRKMLYYSAVILLFIGFLTLINKNRAKTILKGEQATKIEFVFEKKDVKTDSNLSYIGQTENYLFLRLLKEKTTLVYPKEKIELIKIMKK